ncbi:DUF6221 family protein [Streptomyces sp. NPDC059477]|uniref:DUF6221 family protein n=1 Tax=Streptomyces sp. NPDC059477 TaxID=3346847 RepID=UPI0036A8BA87
MGANSSHWPVAYTDSHRASADCRHIAAHDPARALREIDAKRQILALHIQEDTGAEGCIEYLDQYGWQSWMPLARLKCAICGLAEPDGKGIPCTTLRVLALPYADRDGYRYEWRPYLPPAPGTADGARSEADSGRAGAAGH